MKNKRYVFKLNVSSLYYLRFLKNCTKVFLLLLTIATEYGSFLIVGHHCTWGLWNKSRTISSLGRRPRANPLKKALKAPKANDTSRGRKRQIQAVVKETGRTGHGAKMPLSVSCFLSKVFIFFERRRGQQQQ